MAFEFEPGFGYDIELQYLKQDGTPGALDLSTGPLTAVLSVPNIATVVVDPFDPVTGIAMVHVDHNGGVGEFTVSILADGDLLPGATHIHPIVWTEQFVALAPLGATSVTAQVSGKRPTATV